MTLRHGYSPVNLLHIFRTPSLKNLWVAASVYMFVKPFKGPQKRHEDPDTLTIITKRSILDVAAVLDAPL